MEHNTGKQLPNCFRQQHQLNSRSKECLSYISYHVHCTITHYGTLYIVQCTVYTIVWVIIQMLSALIKTCVEICKYASKDSNLMIDGDKKVSKQPFASFPKVNSLQSWEYYAKIALILSLGMNYSIVINKCF